MLMRRIIAPQAIRTMIPAFGNETVSALKNSSLASSSAGAELTLRSTQLASSTFDFFSIFFASGLIYLLLTGASAVIQLVVERSLDLDRPAPQERLARLHAVVSRADAGSPIVAQQAAPGQVLRDNRIASVAAPRTSRRAIGSCQARRLLARNNIVVDVSGLYKAYTNQPVLAGRRSDGAGRRSCRAARAERIGQEHAAAMHQPPRRLGCRHRQGRRPSDGLSRGRQAAVAAGAGAKSAPSVGVGMVFQQFNLFGHLTALENVAGPLRWVHGVSRADADRRARDLLDRVGLSDRADALPRHLSGGQQQRVAIARAMAPNPTVLLLDEPTSALDPELVNEVLEVIRRLAVEDGLTMIISTHQLRFADEVADRVVFLSGGSIIEEGPAHDVLTRPRHPVTQRFLSVVEADHKPLEARA